MTTFQPSPSPSTPGRLQNRVAIVTGSSSGLGAAISLALAAEGASIFCIDLHPSPRNNININININPTTQRTDDDLPNRLSSQPGTHERIRQKGGEAMYHKADVTQAREMELAVRACVRRYKRVDIMVNNAGVRVESTRTRTHTHVRPLRCHETSEEDYDRAMAVNAKGMFLGCKYVLKQMLDGQEMVYASRGWIVNTASIHGLVPDYGTPSYCASKGAAVMLTNQIAMDYAKDLIHCNALCPGFLQNSMTQNLQS
jgi:NAD(P)-dependent dehydrogenase (short-subunit alcohol dehydrogenase family)